MLVSIVVIMRGEVAVQALGHGVVSSASADMHVKPMQDEVKVPSGQTKV
jgi:hypothetical protein